MEGRKGRRVPRKDNKEGQQGRIARKDSKEGHQGRLSRKEPCNIKDGTIEAIQYNQGRKEGR
jgi:hypothetical protein